MTSHRVYFGGGEQPVVTIPHRDGRPLRVTAATYAILDTRHPDNSDDHELVAAGTAAAVDAVSTTLTVRAGRAAEDRRHITVTSTAGYTAGKHYLLEAPDGRAELVRAAAVPSATTLLTTAEIAGDYFAGTTLRGVEVTALFPAEAADDEQNLDDMAWVIAWDFAGLPPIREAIRLHRGEEAELASLEDLKRLDPSLSSYGGDRTDLALHLAQAHRNFRVDLTMAGANESDLLTGMIGHNAVVHLAAALALSHSRDEGAVERGKSYAARYAQLLAGLQVGAKKPDTTALDRRTETETTINPASLFRPF